LCPLFCAETINILVGAILARTLSLILKQY
jgi:hypothetical protein